jgi:PKD repeat protein
MRIAKAIMVPAFLLIVSGGCYKNEPVPFADFTFKGTNDFKIPCKVTFLNNSVNSFHWLWTFHDDSTSWSFEPVKVYTRPGKYLVTLRAYTESENEWASTARTVEIKDTVK